MKEYRDAFVQDIILRPNAVCWIINPMIYAWFLMIDINMGRPAWGGMLLLSLDMLQVPHLTRLRLFKPRPLWLSLGNTIFLIISCSKGKQSILMPVFRSVRERLGSNVYLHTKKSFRNHNKSNRNQIVFSIFWLIWNQTNVRLTPNQSENGKYNLISGWFNKISKRFLCV